MSDRAPSGIGRGRLAALMANPRAESGSSEKTGDVLPKQAGRGQLLHSASQAVCLMIALYLFPFLNCCQSF